MKLNQTKMIRLGAVVAGVAVLYVLFTSYSGAKGAVLDRAEELGGSGSMAPSSNGGPYMSMPHGVAGNATSVSGMSQPCLLLSFSPTARLVQIGRQSTL